MAGRVVTNAPFSADIVTETAQTLGDGNHIKQTSTVHFSRDSQGRTRGEQNLGGAAQLGVASAVSGKTVVFISDPVAGASYALDAASKTASKSVHGMRGAPGGRGAFGQNAPNRPRPDVAGPGGRGSRNNQNVKSESLGTQTIEGVQAQGTRSTLTIPAGQMGNEQPIQIVTERWYSPELQAFVLVKHSDPRNGDTVTRYTNISRAEPVPTLFQVPADYKVQERAARPGNAQ